MNRYAVVLFLLLASCSVQKSAVHFKQAAIRYEGRIEYKEDAAVLSWPGTSVKVNFNGTGISAVLKDRDTANYYNVIVDNKVVLKIHTDTAKHHYVLAAALPAGNHTVELFKRTEWDKGSTLFYGFELAKGGRLLPPPELPKRKIEFYGNSITCGYAVEDSSGKDSYHGYFENNYVSYAAITARHFNAEYNCISKSGIGIMLSWFPLIMPEMYDRLNPNDPLSKWDFTAYTPDVVVINLFQNDSWLILKPEHEQFKNRFGSTPPNEAFIIQAYKNFVASIRNKYPQANIICALGNMDATKTGSPWPGYVEKAISQLHDKKIYTHFFPYKNTGGHPNVAEQKVMAESLIKFIEEKITW